MGVEGQADADESSNLSPWSTDEIAADPPPEFAWDRPDPPDDEIDPVRDGSSRHTNVLVAVGCAAVLLLGAVVLWPGDDTPTESGDTDVGPATTLGTLPSAEDEPATSDVPEEPPNNGDDLLANAPPDVSGDAMTIELPAAVAAIEAPTEIVLNAAGELVTLSLPSGNVRRAGVSGSLGSGFVVAPDASAWFDGNAVQILPRVGPPLSVDIDVSTNAGGYLSDWLVDETGTTRFLVNTFDQNENQQLTVTPSGDVAVYEPQESRYDTFDFYGGIRSAGGEVIVNDAGGAYVLSTDGDATRISSGRALGANANFVLLRECDESLACSYLVHDRTTGERRPSAATSEDLGRAFGFDLAPDGRATLAYDASGQERTVVDLVDGGVLTGLGRTNSTDRNTQWAPDSSGVFVANPTGDGLLFVDPGSGESVPFATELGRVSGLGVRAPEAELTESADVIATRPLTFSDAPVAPIDLHVVVLGHLGSMALLDLDDGSAAVWSVPGTTGSTAPDLFAVGDEVVVLPRGVSDGFVSAYGSTAPLDLPEGDEMPGFHRFQASAPGIVWSPLNGRGVGVDHEVVRIHGDGALTGLGAAITLYNSELLGGDGTGKLVARIAGDVFVVSVNGTTKLTEGDLLALGPSIALVRSCDDDLRCSVDRIDRSTGEVLSQTRSPTVVDLLASARPVLLPGRSPRLSGTMSPDGTAAIVRGGAAGEPGQWSLADFSTGGRIDLPSPADAQPIIWNADSSVAVYVSEGDVVLVDRVAGRTSTLEGLGEVRSITDVDPSFSEPTFDATGTSGSTGATTL